MSKNSCYLTGKKTGQNRASKNGSKKIERVKTTKKRWLFPVDGHKHAVLPVFDIESFWDPRRNMFYTLSEVFWAYLRKNAVKNSKMRGGVKGGLDFFQNNIHFGDQGCPLASHHYLLHDEHILKLLSGSLQPPLLFLSLHPHFVNYLLFPHPSFTQASAQASSSDATGVSKTTSTSGKSAQCKDIDPLGV